MTSREKFEQGLNEYRKTTKKEVSSNSREKFEQGLNNYRKVKANTEFVENNTQNINVHKMANERYNTPKADIIQPFSPIQAKQSSYNSQDFREQDKLKMAAYEVAKRNQANTANREQFNRNAFDVSKNKPAYIPIPKQTFGQKAAMLGQDVFTGIGEGLGNLATGVADLALLTVNYPKYNYDKSKGQPYKPLVSTDKWREFNKKHLSLPEGAGVDRQIAKGAGNMVADIAQVIGTGGVVKGAGVGANLTKGINVSNGNKIAQRALQSGVTGGVNSVLNSAGDQVDLQTAAKNLARDTMFYAAGGAASAKVNVVAEQLMTKYGLNNSVAAEIARNAIEGLAFDATGYAATMPTYKGLGDAMPTKEEIGYDMAIGFMFDFVPGTYDTIKTTKANKANMKTTLDSFKKDYELSTQLEQSNKSNPKSLNTVYDSMLRRVETARETLNNTNALGQDKQVNELKMLFDTTQREIMNKKANLNNREVQPTTRINAVEQTKPTMIDNTTQKVNAVESNIEQITSKPRKTTTAYTPDNKEVELSYKLVSANDLVTSNDTSFNKNADYPQELQPRQRDRASSQMQVDKIMSNLNPELLGESKLISDGSPITKGNIVESGNGRTIALKKGYETNNANMAAYKEYLVANADKFGIDVNNMPDNPILVRERTGDMDSIEFSKAANVSSVAQMSAAETAISDADKMSERVLARLNTGDDLNINAAGNKDFITDFVRDVIPENERGSIATKEGNLSINGIQRVKNALFQKAYGNVKAIEMLSESTDVNIKNVINAMTLTSPKIVRVKAGIKEGVLHDLDISQELSNSAIKLSDIKSRNESVELTINQIGMFNEMSDVEKNILTILDKNNKSQKKLKDFVSLYYDMVEKAGNPNQIGLIDNIVPTKLELLEAARRVHENETGENITLWESERGSNTKTSEKLQQTEGKAKAKSTKDTGVDTYSSAINGPQLRAAGTNTDVANTKKASEIYKEFSTKLGLAIKNRPQRGALGTHDPTSHLVRIKKTNDLSVLSHETGHYFDKEYKFSKNEKLNSELLELGKPSSTPKYSNDRIKREGVAEFTRLYLTDNAAAKELAPKMYKSFTTEIDKGILKVLDGLSADIDKFSNLSVIEQAKKTISFAGDKVTKEKLTDKVNGITNFERKAQEAYSAIYDRKYPLVWAAKKMAGEEQGKYIRDDISAARGYAESAEYSIKEKQTDAYNKEIGEGLESILTPVLKSQEAYDDFVNYALNGRRSIDYFNKGLDFPSTKEACEQVRIYNEQKYPEFKEIFDKLQTYQKNSLKQFVDIGMMSQEKYDSIMKENPNYIPGNRVVEALYKSYGSSDLSPVKKLKGGGQDFVDAIETIISNTYIHKKIVSDYMIKKDFIEIANSVEDMGNLVTKAPAKMQPTTLNMAQLEKTFTDVAKKAGISDEEIKNNLDMDFMATFFRQNVVADVNQIAFPYVDADGKDKITLYDVDPLIYSAFTRNPIMNPVVNAVIKKLAVLTKIKKAGIIFTPLYVGRNLARDTVGNLVNSRNDISAFDIGKGMLEAVTNGDIAKLARKSGAVTGFFSPDRKFVQNSIKDMQLTHKKAKNFNEAVNKLFKTTGNIARDKLMSPGEMAGRLAEFEKTIINQYKKAYGNTLKNKEILDIVMDDPKKYRRILNRAAFNTRDITVDFNRSGGAIEDLQINRIIAFFNPALQGAEKFARNFADKETRGRATAKLAMTAAITMAISALLEGNENYEELPDYRKDYYINIPLGDPKTATKFLPVPLQYDVAFTSLATPRRLVEHFVKKNPKAFANYTDTIEQAFMFSTMPDLLNMYIELESNKDWTGRNILNYGDEGKKPYLQYGDFTSETSKAIGYMLKDIEGIPEWMKSPKQLDHVIKGQTGTMGTIALNSIDQIAGTKDGIPVFGGLANGFIIDATKNPKSINDFYENKKLIDSDYSEYEETGRKQKYDVVATKETFAAYYKEVTKINKAIKELNSEKDTEKIGVLTKQRLELMKKANKMYEDSRKKN